MTTLEDVFWLYERKSKLLKTPIIPTTIGDDDVSANLCRKSYIKPGQECPICLDPIIHKSNAYITSCGHGFHKSCIVPSYLSKMKHKSHGTYNCPMCRASIGSAIEYINERYNCENMLDTLENFWYRYNVAMPMVCDSIYSTDTYHHFLGVNTNCHECLSYRNTGT